MTSQGPSSSKAPFPWAAKEKSVVPGQMSSVCMQRMMPIFFMRASLVCLSGLGRLLMVFGDDVAQQVVTHDGVQFRPVMGRGLGEQEAKWE